MKKVQLSTTQKRLIIMLAAVLVMGGLLVLLLVSEPDNSIKPEDIASATDAEEILGSENDLLIYREFEELERLVLTNTEGVFTVERGADDALTIKELAGIPLNEDFLRIVWYDVLSVGYSSFFTLPEDGLSTLADYGLDSPQVVAECYYYDGTTETIRIGSTLSGDEDCFYFQLNDNPTIYINTFETSLFQGHKYWVNDNVFSADYSEEVEISRIECDFHDGGAPLIIEPHTGADKSDPFFDKQYIITSPELCAPDDYSMALLIDELSWLIAYEAVVVYPTDSELADYGLDDPYVTLTLVRNGVEHRLDLARYDYDELYAVVRGIPVIYQIDAENNQILASLSAQSLRSTDVHIRYFDAIEAITLETADGSYTFRTERKRMIDESELYEYTAWCGDTELDLSSYKAFLEVFNSASASSYYSGSTGDPNVTVTIKYFDSFGKPDDVITYSECGTRRYVCKINGSGSAVVTTMWLDKLTAAAEALAAGERPAL